MYDPYAEFTKYTLLNGLDVYFAHWDRPWVGVEIVVHSGAREDSIGKSGLAHFVEHTVNENVPGFKHDDVREFFDTVGGRVGFGSTGYLATAYGFAIPAKVDIFRKALSIFGSMLLEAQIQKNIENERKVILREFNGKFPIAERVKWNLEVQKALFNGHRLENYVRPIGLPMDFLSITEADLQGFYDKYYTPKNMSLVVLGGLSIEAIISEIQNSPFGMKKEGERNAIPNVLQNFPVVTDHMTMISLSNYVSFKVDQAEFRAKWSFPAKFSEQTRRVFNLVLGMLLTEEIREKRGLAYSISTNYTYFQDVCDWVINGNVSPESIPHIDELIQDCISMVPSRRDIFDRKLSSCLLRCEMIDLSGETLVKDSAGDITSYQKIITMQQIWEQLNEVRFEQMEEAAAFLSADRKCTFITCP